MATQPKKLSVVSTQWDVENKGYLSKAQQSMRNMDEEGTGTLSADKLAIFANSMEGVTRENKEQKKRILGLGFLVVVLFASTLIGTILAIKANKEISVTPDGLAVAPSTGLVLRTEAQGFAAGSTYVLDEETGITHECVLLSDIAEMYIAYGKGMTVTYKGNAGDLEDVDENTAPIHVASGGAYISTEHVQFGEEIKFQISSSACDRLLGGTEEDTASVSTDGSVRKLSKQLKKRSAKLTFIEALKKAQAPRGRRRRRKVQDADDDDEDDDAEDNDIDDDDDLEDDDSLDDDLDDLEDEYDDDVDDDDVEEEDDLESEDDDDLEDDNLDYDVESEGDDTWEWDRKLGCGCGCRQNSNPNSASFGECVRS